MIVKHLFYKQISDLSTIETDVHYTAELHTKLHESTGMFIVSFILHILWISSYLLLFYYWCKIPTMLKTFHVRKSLSWFALLIISQFWCGTQNTVIYNRNIFGRTVEIWAPILWTQKLLHATWHLNNVIENYTSLC